MKIALSTSSKSLDSNLNLRFGRCEYIAIYDTESKDVKYYDNPGINSTHGAGISASNFIVERDVDVVITGNLGPNALKILQGNKIKGFSSSEVTLNKAIENYFNESLDEILLAGPQHH